MLTNLWLRLKVLIKRRQLDRDLEEELAFHLALREEGYQAAGVTAEEAHAAAQREFGNATKFREACREMWTFQWLENFWQDLRFASRTLRQQPGFTAMAILSLGLGIGANTAVFTLVNDLLLKAIPDPAGLVSLGKAEGAGIAGGMSGSIDLFPYGFYTDLKTNAGSIFKGICAYSSFTIAVTERSGGPAAGAPTQALTALVSPEYFPVLGVYPILGRSIDSSNALQPVVVISYDYWRKRFSADPNIVGQSIVVNKTPVSVIGVAPARFYGVALDTRPPDMWLPIAMQPQAMLGGTLVQPKPLLAAPDGPLAKPCHTERCAAMAQS